MPFNMTTRRGARTPVVLIVLDGWGFRPGRDGNAIELGATPVWHRLWERAPRPLLEASGLAGGPPEGQMGTREAGPLNLGAARGAPPVTAIPPYGHTGVVAPGVGRYYAMDRDKRWERTKLAYDAIVHGLGAPAQDAVTAIRQAYDAGETDEFVKPRVVTGTPRLKTGDGVFCVNFRADRMRQIVRALAMDGFDGFDVTDRPKVSLVTLTQYDETFPFPVAFGPMVLAKIVAEVLADRGKTMFRTAETEKYAHVTYFFNGGLGKPFKREGRLPGPVPRDVGAYGPCPGEGGSLRDVGPTILNLLGVELPKEMTGTDLRKTP